jgi:hypothetical protein
MADETAVLEAERVRHSMRIETEKLYLDKLRFRSETVKWIAIAVGAVASFAVIDYGKLQLERFQSYAENKRELLKSYLAATDAAQPDLWTRKLDVIIRMTEDEQVRSWAEQEKDKIETYAARDALYREALKVASQLVEPSQLEDPARKQLRYRFNQLYWADLPFVDESPDVAAAMIAFRSKLMAAETAGAQGSTAWNEINIALIQLSTALKQAISANRPARPPKAPPPQNG